MSRIELSGLIGSHPLGALASFGLLRVLAEQDSTARLSFVERDDWIAVLDSRLGSGEELLALLKTWIAARAPAVLGSFGDDDVRVAPSLFQATLSEALFAPTPNDELASFLVGLAADGAEDQSKHMVKPSPFYMASGQQSFIDTVRKIHGHVRKGDSWGETLFGPWSYATPEWGCGWDPGTERMHALRYKAPAKDKTACVAGAVWLGFEALPLFPTFSEAGDVRTVGWNEHDYLDHWRWPLPTVPVAIGTLRLLLASLEVAGRLKGKKPLRNGIGAIYESTRHEFGQGYAVFRPARRLA
jgi:hypothetical protein